MVQKPDQERTAGASANIRSSMTNPAESAGNEVPATRATRVAPNMTSRRFSARKAQLAGAGMLGEVPTGGKGRGVAVVRRRRRARFDFLLGGMSGILQATPFGPICQAARVATFIRQDSLSPLEGANFERYSRCWSSASRNCPRPVAAREGSRDRARSTLLRASSGLSR